MTITGLDCVSNCPDDFIIVSLFVSRGNTSIVDHRSKHICHRGKIKVKPSKNQNKKIDKKIGRKKNEYRCEAK
jgi:hypothetical protein